VFGMVERGSCRALTFRVPADRTRDTLVTRLVQEFIQPGTVILSDKFSPYFNLNDIGYTHLMVNHSENFVDPYTGAHTNTIEGVWNAVKKKLKRMCGTFKHQLPSYLDEFNWQRVYPGECFKMITGNFYISHIGLKMVNFGGFLGISVGFSQTGKVLPKPRMALTKPILTPGMGLY